MYERHVEEASASKDQRHFTRSNREDRRLRQRGGLRPVWVT